MHPDSRQPTEEQAKKLCDMLHKALVDIRNLSWGGHSEQAGDLADTFHNLSHEIWCDYFSFSYFRKAFLLPYRAKWPRGPYDYLAMLDEIEKLG